QNLCQEKSGYKCCILQFFYRYLWQEIAKHGEPAQRLSRNASAGSGGLFQVSHGPLDAVQEEFLEARVFPGGLLVSEAGVEDAAFPILAGPGQWPAVKARTHGALAQVHGGRVELQEDVRGFVLKVADLIDLVVDLKRGRQ